MTADRIGPVAGIVLAAGSSRRMGRNKLLLRIDGESLARRAARGALAAGLEPVVVVLGHEAQLVEPELAGLPLRIVVNADHAGGIHTSRRAGFTALPSDTVAAIVMLADMPFVSGEMLATLVSRYRESSALLVVSEYEGKPAPPILYARSLFPEIIQGEGEGRVGQVLREHAADAVTVAWPAAALADLDLPEDVERLVASDAGVDGSK